VPIKSTTTRWGVGRDERKQKKKKRRRKKVQKKLQNKSTHKNNNCFSWVTAVRVLSTAILTSLGCPPNTVLTSDQLWGQLRFWSGPTPLCSCLQYPQLSELVHFLLWELSMAFYIFHRHRVCLVDRVDLTCSLCSWWEGFGSSSLATLPLGFICGFISTSACGSSTGDCSWGCRGGLGFAPVRARCGGGAAAWVSGVLAAPDTEAGWRLEQQEI